MPVGGVYHDGYGAVVVDGDLHVRLELPGLYIQSRLLKEAEGAVEEGGGGFGRHGVAEARAAAAAGVAVEGELAYDQQVGGGVQRGKVEFAVGVAENAQVDGLVDDVGGVFIVVVPVDAYQDYEARVDAADGLAVDRDGRMGDALNEGAQRGYSSEPAAAFAFGLEEDSSLLPESADAPLVSDFVPV